MRSIGRHAPSGLGRGLQTALAAAMCSWPGLEQSTCLSGCHWGTILPSPLSLAVLSNRLPAVLQAAAHARTCGVQCCCAAGVQANELYWGAAHAAGIDDSDFQGGSGSSDSGDASTTTTSSDDSDAASSRSSESDDDDGDEEDSSSSGGEEQELEEGGVLTVDDLQALSLQQR